MTWHLTVDKQHTKDIVDELMMRNAIVQFKDLGDVYMLTVDNSEQHIHITIPARAYSKAFVFEQFTPARQIETNQQIRSKGEDQ